MSSLKDVVKDEIIKTSSCEALEENRQFLSSLSVAQVCVAGVGVCVCVCV